MAGLKSTVSQPPPMPAFFWEPLEVSIDPSLAKATLPLGEGAVGFKGGAEKAFRALPDGAQASILERGFAIIAPHPEGGDGPTKGRAESTSEIYRRLDDAEVPLFVTLDALLEVLHAGLYATLAEVERVELEPLARKTLARVASRLDAMNELSSDTARGHRIARGVVGVAAVLLDPQAPVPAVLEADIREEVRRLRAVNVDPVASDSPDKAAKAARPSLQISPILGVPVDYSGARVASGTETQRRDVATAFAWLAMAPLVLVGRDETLGPDVSVTTVRDHTRAALLLANALHPDVDREAATAWDRLENIERFLIGAADDWSPSELGALASSTAGVGIDVRDVKSFDEVARVDRLRRAAAKGFHARVHDGQGDDSWFDLPSVPAATRESRFVARLVPPTARLLGARTGLDAVVQQALVYPVVGGYKGSRSVSTLEDGKRTLSRPLDFAAVLGSKSAREALHGDGDDAYDGFDSTLKKLIERRPAERETTRHASVHLSALDLIATILTPSAADASLPASGDGEHNNRMLGVALAAHAIVRHDFAGPGRPRARGAESPATDRTPRTPLVFVEPHPEAIGRMVALLRQLERGLMSYQALPNGPALETLESAERFLTAAFQSALLMANGLPASDDTSKTLAGITDWLSTLEQRAGGPAARGVDAHVDLRSDRALAIGTGSPEILASVVRDPKSGELVLAFGAAARPLEFVHPRGEPLTDASWRERVGKGAIAPPTWSAAHHFATSRSSQAVSSPESTRSE